MVTSLRYIYSSTAHRYVGLHVTLYTRTQAVKNNPVSRSDGRKVWYVAISPGRVKVVATM